MFLLYIYFTTSHCQCFHSAENSNCTIVWEVWNNQTDRRRTKKMRRWWSKIYAPLFRRQWNHHTPLYHWEHCDWKAFDMVLCHRSGSTWNTIVIRAGEFAGQNSLKIQHKSAFWLRNEENVTDPFCRYIGDASGVNNGRKRMNFRVSGHVCILFEYRGWMSDFDLIVWVEYVFNWIFFSLCFASIATLRFLSHAIWLFSCWAHPLHQISTLAFYNSLSAAIFIIIIP